MLVYQTSLHIFKKIFSQGNFFYLLFLEINFKINQISNQNKFINKK